MVALLLLASLARAESAEELITRMKRVWDGLGTYRTGQMLQERVRGELGPEQRVRVAFRKPWEIQLVWETVHPGRKVYWCATRHGGEVQVYPGGLTGRTLGILSFAEDSSILKRDTNYTPSAGGFGYLVETVVKYATAPPAERPTASAPVEQVVGGQRGWSIRLSKITHPRYADAELVVSQATGLPLKFTGWTTQGEVMERYEWFDTVVDPALVDGVDFDVGYPRP